MLGKAYDPDAVQTAIDERRDFALANLTDRILTITSPASAAQEFKVAHGLDAPPVYWLVIWQNKAGSVYAGDRAADRTYAYLKTDAAALTFKIIFFGK